MTRAFTQFTEAGINTTDSIHHVPGVIHGTKTPADYLAGHPGGDPTHHITRTWEDNDTPIFEKKWYWIFNY